MKRSMIIFFYLVLISLLADAAIKAKHNRKVLDQARLKAKLYWEEFNIARQMLTTEDRDMLDAIFHENDAFYTIIRDSM